MSLWLVERLQVFRPVAVWEFQPEDSVTYNDNVWDGEWPLRMTERSLPLHTSYLQYFLPFTSSVLTDVHSKSFVLVENPQHIRRGLLLKPQQGLAPTDSSSVCRPTTDHHPFLPAYRTSNPVSISTMSTEKSQRFPKHWMFYPSSNLPKFGVNPMSWSLTEV